jgi:hypothetical protein
VTHPSICFCEKTALTLLSPCFITLTPALFHQGRENCTDNEKTMKRFQFNLRRILVMIFCFSLALACARWVLVFYNQHSFFLGKDVLRLFPTAFALTLLSGAAFGAGFGVLFGDTFIGLACGFFLTLAIVAWILL